MRNNLLSRPVKPGPVFTLLALLLFCLPVLAQIVADPPSNAGVPVAPATGIDWTTIVAAIGAVVILARLIVKLTPTPADDTVLEKIIDALKHIGLNLKTVALLGFGLWALGFGLLVLTGCGSPHPTTINVGSTNGNVSGGVTTQITTNIDAGVTGSYDPTSGSWTAGLVVTFKDAPPASIVALASAAGAVSADSPLRTPHSALKWVITRPDLTSAAQTNFIQAALASGATVKRIVLATE